MTAPDEGDRTALIIAADPDDGDFGAAGLHGPTREGLQPHKVREVLLWNSNQPNFDVDITSEVERKLHASLAHVTRFGRAGRFRDVRPRTLESGGRPLPGTVPTDPVGVLMGPHQGPVIN